jgi:predicted MPP superfamily phosphohydrolase
MKSMMWMILFMLLPVLGIAYIAWHLWALLPLSALWRLTFIAVGLAAFLLLFLAIGRRLDSLPLTLAQWGYEVGTSSIMVMLYLVLIFLVLDLGRLCRLVPRDWLYRNGWTAVVLLVFVTAIFVYANIHYNNKVRVSLDLATPKPLARDYRVVMLSDLHIGYHNTRSELARWVDLINAEHPDFILVAGDIIDGSMRPILEEHMAEEFRRLRAPVYASLGNHEYYAGSPEARQFYADAGIRLLSDSHVVIDSCIVIVGRDDRTNLRRKPLSELVSSARLQSSVPDSLFTLVLDHQPYQLERAEQAGVDFQLSGHTHRGQVWPISWITDALYECSWGSHQRGHTRYYISSGLGIWGGKYRIGTQSEYIVATIRSVANGAK